MNSGRRSTAVLLGLLLSVAAFGCGDGSLEAGKEEKTDRTEAGALLSCFLESNPGRRIVKTARRDLNDDGREDLIVMYRVSEDRNMMRVVLDLESGCFETNEEPAPFEHQSIQFRDIDRKPPMEFIVQGMRGVKAGFAVFRIEGDRLVDLFGEGMEDCC